MSFERERKGEGRKEGEPEVSLSLEKSSFFNELSAQKLHYGSAYRLIYSPSARGNQQRSQRGSPREGSSTRCKRGRANEGTEVEAWSETRRSRTSRKNDVERERSDSRIDLKDELQDPRIF